MQAALLTEPFSPFQIETVDLAPPKAGEVLVKVAASGVCHSDWHVVQGKTPYPMPIVTGHEGAGIVEAVGAGVSRVQPGDHVTLSFRPDCGDCFYCLQGKPNLCETFTPSLRAGLQRDGTSRLSWRGAPVYIFTGVGCFAEYVVVPMQGGVLSRKEWPLEVAD